MAGKFSKPAARYIRPQPTRVETPVAEVDEAAEEDTAQEEPEETSASVEGVGATMNAGQPAKLNPKEPTVLMVFPNAVRLTLDNHKTIHFRAGIHKVPVSLSDHWYLAAHGVEKADDVADDHE